LNVNKLLKKILENWPAKILSLSLAIFLFVFHNINLLKTKNIISPLKVEGVSRYIITGRIPSEIKVELRSDDKTLSSIGETDIITYIDLSKYTAEGTYRLPVQIIKNGNALVAETLEISVEPDDITIRLEKRETKTVSIVPQFQGVLAGGFDLASGTLTPDTVQLEGPVTLVNSISSVTTEAIDISGRSSDFSAMVILVSPASQITLQDTLVNFHAKVRSVYVEKDFSDLPIDALMLDEKFEAEIVPRTAVIKLHGTAADFGEYVPAENLLTLDCSAIVEAGTYQLALTVNTPEQFSLVSYEPEVVTVEVRERTENGE
jgi:YbbR domain-containing protein